MTTRANKILESLNKRNRKLLKESKSVSEHEIGKLHELDESDFGYGYEIPYDKIDSVIEPGKILTELKKAVENGIKLVVCNSMYRKDGGVPVDGKNRVLLNQGTLILDDLWYVGFPESLKSNVIELKEEPNFKTYTTHVPYGSTTASWDDEVLTTDTKDIIKNYDLFKFEDNAWDKGTCEEAADLIDGKIKNITEIRTGTKYNQRKDEWETQFNINDQYNADLYMWEF